LALTYVHLLGYYSGSLMLVGPHMSLDIDRPRARLSGSTHE
jgi:hypothetical protein